MIKILTSLALSVLAMAASAHSDQQLEDQCLLKQYEFTKHIRDSLELVSYTHTTCSFEWIGADHPVNISEQTGCTMKSSYKYLIPFDGNDSGFKYRYIYRCEL